MRIPVAALFAFALTPMSLALAQTPSFSLGTVYQCPNGNSFQVLSCAGPADSDWCDVQSTIGGQQQMRGKSTRAQIMMLVPRCSAQTALPAHAGSSGAATPASCVRSLPPGRHKDDYELGDKVQVNIRGVGWIEGTVVNVALGIDNEYKVKVSGDRVAVASARDLCFVSTAEADRAMRQAGKPPKPGLASCAGKFEGRYSSAPGSPAMVTIVFRSGKATVRTPDVVATDMKMTALSSEKDAECWTGGGKIYLVWVDGSNFDFPIDINDDGTLDTAYGELKKKGN